jgi:hypothetical protein
MLSLSAEAFQAGAALRPADSVLNVLHAIHVGHALSLNEPIVSTDPLCPKLDELEDLDPRSL